VQKAELRRRPTAKASSRQLSTSQLRFGVAISLPGLNNYVRFIIVYASYCYCGTTTYSLVGGNVLGPAPATGRRTLQTCCSLTAVTSEGGPPVAVAISAVEA
jgi:hypothetical protein